MLKKPFLTIISVLSLFIIETFEVKALEYKTIIDVLESPRISFEKKYDLLAEISKLELSEQQEALSILLENAKTKKQIGTFCGIYSRIAHNYMFLGNVNRAKLALDSASKFLSNTTDNNIIALYNYVSGDYYNLMINEVKAHKHYYEAIRYYEQSKEGYLEAIYILHNIAFCYIQKGDDANLKVILMRMKNIVSKAKKSKAIDVAYGRINAYYYSILYKKEPKTIYLDSAIIYDKKIIDLFESNKHDDIIPEEIAYNYINFAENSLKKEKVDYNQIEPLINRAVAIAAPTDTAMQINSLWLKGQIYKKQNKINDAENVLKEQLRLMKNWSVSDNFVMYVDLYNCLAGVSNNLGKYKEAFLFQQEELKYRKLILDKEKYQIISDLQTKYETEKKETQIKLQEQIILFLSILCILILAVSFFIVKWKRVVKALTIKQKKIVQLQKSEAKLQIQSEGTKVNIQENQDILVNKVLSHVKNKLQSYPEDQKKYLDKLETIDKDSIFVLKNKGLNDLRIQYCICFGIGMKKEYISLCYNILDQTIRKHRSTIKADLELERDDDLNLYLIDLFNGNIY